MWTLLLAVAAVFMAGISLYNKLVKLREQVDAAWADIDVQLKRRHDLIPNVVETVTFNTRINQVPSNIIANSFNFREREFFEVPEGEKAVPNVSSSDGTAG